MANNETEANFAINLDARDGGSARNMASALLDLKSKIKEDTEELREMKRALRDIKGSSAASTETFAKLKDAIEAKKASIASARSQFLAMGGSLKKGAHEAKQASGAYEGFADSISQANGPLGSMGGMLSKLKGFFTNPLTAVVALAAGVLALAAATVRAAIAIGKYAIAQADARRSEALRLEGMNALMRARRRATASVGDLQEAIDRGARSTNRSREELAGYGRQLSRFGLRGQALAQAVETMGTAAMVQGGQGARRFLWMARRAQLAGQSVSSVAETYRRELGPIASRQMSSIGNQMAQFKENISELFSGLRVDGFLSAMREITDMFSQNTATGRALKAIIEVTFQPLLDAAKDGTPLVKKLFQEAVIGALALQIKIRQVRIKMLEWYLWMREKKRAISDFFSLDGASEMLSGLTGGIRSGGQAVADEASGLADRISRAFSDALGIRSPSRVFRTFGEFIAAGISDGMRRGARGVLQSTRNLADTASGAFAARLQIRSPSRVFEGFGGDITDGLRAGVGSDPIEVPVPTMAGQAEQGASLSQSTVSVSVGDIYVNAESEQGARSVADSIREELEKVLEGLSAEMGAR